MTSACSWKDLKMFSYNNYYYSVAGVTDTPPSTPNVSVFVCVYVCLCVCICVQGIKRENTRLQAALSKKMDYKERTDCNLHEDRDLHSMRE